eukprot:GDKJ01013830.1.p1 GENE.GDKJ01013830.1~~GDKJ01013830.1.p1  ORF type:complete len:978 (+),score=244.94 GDKJ01013830.1:402-3335(+)
MGNEGALSVISGGSGSKGVHGIGSVNDPNYYDVWQGVLQAAKALLVQQNPKSSGVAAASSSNPSGGATAAIDAALSQNSNSTYGAPLECLRFAYDISLPNAKRSELLQHEEALGEAKLHSFFEAELMSTAWQCVTAPRGKSLLVPLWSHVMILPSFLRAVGVPSSRIPLITQLCRNTFGPVVGHSFKTLSAHHAHLANLELSLRKGLVGILPVDYSLTRQLTVLLLALCTSEGSVVLQILTATMKVNGNMDSLCRMLVKNKLGSTSSKLDAKGELNSGWEDFLLQGGGGGSESWNSTTSGGKKNVTPSNTQKKKVKGSTAHGNIPQQYNAYSNEIDTQHPYMLTGGGGSVDSLDVLTQYLLTVGSSSKESAGEFFSSLNANLMMADASSSQNAATTGSGQNVLLHQQSITGSLSNTYIHSHHHPNAVSSLTNTLTGVPFYSSSSELHPPAAHSFESIPGFAAPSGAILPKNVFEQLSNTINAVQRTFNMLSAHNADLQKGLRACLLFEDRIYDDCFHFEIRSLATNTNPLSYPSPPIQFSRDAHFSPLQHSSGSSPNALHSSTSSTPPKGFIPAARVVAGGVTSSIACSLVKPSRRIAVFGLPAHATLAEINSCFPAYPARPASSLFLSPHMLPAWHFSFETDIDLLTHRLNEADSLKLQLASVGIKQNQKGGKIVHQLAAPTSTNTSKHGNINSINDSFGGNLSAAGASIGSLASTLVLMQSIMGSANNQSTHFGPTPTLSLQSGVSTNNCHLSVCRLPLVLVIHENPDLLGDAIQMVQSLLLCGIAADMRPATTNYKFDMPDYLRKNPNLIILVTLRGTGRMATHSTDSSNTAGNQMSRALLSTSAQQQSQQARLFTIRSIRDYPSGVIRLTNSRKIGEDLRTEFSDAEKARKHIARLVMASMEFVRFHVQNEMNLAALQAQMQVTTTANNNTTAPLYGSRKNNQGIMISDDEEEEESSSNDRRKKGGKKNRKRG